MFDIPSRLRVYNASDGDSAEVEGTRHPGRAITDMIELSTFLAVVRYINPSLETYLQYSVIVYRRFQVKSFYFCFQSRKRKASTPMPSTPLAESRRLRKT